jgi:hypothetical protein
VLAVAHGCLICGKRGKLHREEERPQPSPRSKESKAKVRPAKPDTKLTNLEATAMAEELKARIRAAKMMSQGVSYSQVVQAQAPVYVAQAPTSAPARPQTQPQPRTQPRPQTQPQPRTQPRPRPYHASSGLLSLRTKQSRYSWKLSSGCKNNRVQKRHQNTFTTSVEAWRTGKNFTLNDMECGGDSF